MTTLINDDLVLLDANLGTDTTSVIRNLAELIAKTGRAAEVEGLFADALAREQKTATGVPGGIAIPHCRSCPVCRSLAGCKVCGSLRLQASGLRPQASGFRLQRSLHPAQIP
ncbi:PTS sugar transporter subunit IIA, partial [Arthrobacter sp. BF1]|uniref:PTS sugar transporter subunit IIA n=1 Tax=Arthrobacter sp. BF1 TaxID=2821145 RepID=UPI001C4EF854